MTAHLVRLNLVLAAMLDAAAAPERGVDVLGADPLAAYRESSARLHRAPRRLASWNGSSADRCWRGHRSEATWRSGSQT